MSEYIPLPKFTNDDDLAEFAAGMAEKLAGGMDISEALEIDGAYTHLIITYADLIDEMITRTNPDVYVPIIKDFAAGVWLSVRSNEMREIINKVAIELVNEELGIEQ